MPVIRRANAATPADEYAKIIEAYKIQNPVKYALKEKVLLARLAELKALKAPVLEEVADEEVEEVVEEEAPKKKGKK